MAYQPIQMPGRPPMFDAMDQVSKSLGELGDQRERQARDATAKKRLDQQDLQNTILKANELARSGDFDGAKALLAPYRGRLAQDHQDALAGGAPSPQGLPPGTPPGAGKIPPAPKMGAPQGGSPMPDSAEFDMDHGQTPEQMGQGDLGVAQPPPAPIEPPPTNAEALMGAQAASQERRRQSAGMLRPSERTLVAFTPPGGQEITLDPMAGVDRMRERKLAQLDQAFGDSKDPVVQKYFPQVRAAAMSGDEDLKPMDALRYMHYMAATEQSGVNTDKRIEHSDTNQDLNRGTRERGQDMTQENSIQTGKDRKASAAISAPFGLKASTALTSAAARFDTEFDRWSKQQRWGSLLQADVALKQALRGVASGNPLSEQGAKVMFGRFERGAMPTEGEMHMLYESLNGRLKNALPAFVEKMQRGGLNPGERQILQDALDTAERETQHQVDKIYNSARKKFGPGSGHENMQGNVNANVAGLLAGAGIERPPVFTAEEGETLPTLSVGAGNPLIGGHPAARKRGKKVPTTTAAPDDEHARAVKWARANLHSAKPDEAAMAAEIMKRNPGAAAAP